MAHTPGPWKKTKCAGIGSWWIEDDGAPCRRRIAIVDDAAGIDDPEANARLAAAAPALLAACKDALAVLRDAKGRARAVVDEDAGAVIGCYVRDAVEQLNAAITKARGEQGGGRLRRTGGRK